MHDQSAACQSLPEALARWAAAGIPTTGVLDLIDRAASSGPGHVEHTARPLRVNGHDLDHASRHDLAAELAARVAAAQFAPDGPHLTADLSPPPAWRALQPVAELLLAAGPLVELLADATDTLGLVRIRALTAGAGNLDAGIWALRGPQ
jgi:hypothetical protein